MDSDAEAALARACRRALAPELQDLLRRVAALEDHPTYALTLRETVAQRQRIVRRMRAEGLSVQRISRAIGVPTATIWRDVGDVDVEGGQVVGVDDRHYAARHSNGNGRANGSGY